MEEIGKSGTTITYIPTRFLNLTMVKASRRNLKPRGQYFSPCDTAILQPVATSFLWSSCTPQAFLLTLKHFSQPVLVSPPFSEMYSPLQSVYFYLNTTNGKEFLAARSNRISNRWIRERTNFSPSKLLIFFAIDTSTRTCNIFRSVLIYRRSRKNDLISHSRHAADFSKLLVIGRASLAATRAGPSCLEPRGIGNEKFY